MKDLASWFDSVAWRIGPSQLVGSDQDHHHRQQFRYDADSEPIVEAAVDAEIIVLPPRDPDIWGHAQTWNYGANLGRTYLLKSLLKQLPYVPQYRFFDLPWLAANLGLSSTNEKHPLFHITLEVLRDALEELGVSARIEGSKVVFDR